MQRKVDASSVEHMEVMATMTMWTMEHILATMVLLDGTLISLSSRDTRLLKVIKFVCF
jgi:hypothetical protein